jgi:outer membrane protein assembly factor BamB
MLSAKEGLSLLYSHSIPASLENRPRGTLGRLDCNPDLNHAQKGITMTMPHNSKSVPLTCRMAGLGVSACDCSRAGEECADLARPRSRGIAAPTAIALAAAALLTGIGTGVWWISASAAAPAAAGPEGSPATGQPAGALHVQWRRQLPPRDPAFGYTMRYMVFDRLYQPVIDGDTVYVSCQHDQSLRALNLADGSERWRFHAEGDLRHPVVAADGLVVLGGDDGWVRGLDARTGRPRWSQRVGPSSRQCIAHDRLAAVYGINAGLLHHEGTVYAAAGYWPADGIFVAAIDLKSGEECWQVQINHRIRPPLAVTGGALHVPGPDSGGSFLALSDGAPIPPQQQPKGKPAPKPSAEAPSGAAPLPAELAGIAKVRVDAGGRAVVVTAENLIVGLAGAPAANPRAWEEPAPAAVEPARAEQAKALGVIAGNAGWCLVMGLKDGTLVEALARSGAFFRVVAIDPDAARVDTVRRALAAREAFADLRLQIIHLDPAAGELPPYIAHLVTAEDPARWDAALLRAAWRSVRPHGGALALPRAGGPDLAAAGLDGARAETAGAWAVLRRPGLPAGAVEWTHEMADPANTNACLDPAIHLPVGTLWYGGRSSKSDNYMVSSLPGTPVMAKGVMVLQGPRAINAYDQYTGRLLWSYEMPAWHVFHGLGIHAGKKEPAEAPEAMEAPVKATEHPRSSGFNLIALPEGVFVGAKDRLVRLDLDTGKELSAWAPPVKDPDGPLCWGNLRAADGVIVATLFSPVDMKAFKIGLDGNGGNWVKDRVPMRHLVGLDLASGKMLWRQKAQVAFVNTGYALGKGRVFAADQLPLSTTGQYGTDYPRIWKELRGAAPPAPTLVVFELASGKQAWRIESGCHVNFLMFHAPSGLVIAPSRHGERWADGDWQGGAPKTKGSKAPEAGVLRGIKPEDGSVAFTRSDTLYKEPLVSLGDVLMHRYGILSVAATGEPATRRNSITGATGPWRAVHRGGCVNLVGAPGFAAWRSGFGDPQAQLSLGIGQDGGCSPHYIPSGGIIVGPAFGLRHLDNRPRSTCVAMVPTADAHAWYALDWQMAAGEPYARVGFNLNAPGARQAPDGCYWIAGGVAVTGAAVKPFRLVPHRVTAADGALPWVACSGVEGAETLLVPVKVSAGPKAKPAGAGKPAAEGGARYRLRLTFVEPDPTAKPGQRIFAVQVGGQKTVEALDIVQRAGAPRRGLVIPCEVNANPAGNGIEIRLTPAAGSRPAVISGIELERVGSEGK